MLSAILGEDEDPAYVSEKSIPGRMVIRGGYVPFDTHGFGHAPLEDQTPYQRAYAPLPNATGQVVIDPEIVLTTTAGPLRWQLFNELGSYTQATPNPGTFAINTVVYDNHAASYPLRANIWTADTSGTVRAIVEREDGTTRSYTRYTPTMSFVAEDQRHFDTLQLNADGTVDEIRFDTGAVYHYPFPSDVLSATVIYRATLAYMETVHGARLNMNYDANGRLSSIQEPAGRQLAFNYGTGADNLNQLESVVDWAGRRYTFLYIHDVWLGGYFQPGVGTVTHTVADTYRISTIYDPSGAATLYNPSPMLPTGDASAYAYIGNGPPLTSLFDAVIDPEGNLIQYGGVVQMAPVTAAFSSFLQPLPATGFIHQYNSYGDESGNSYLEYTSPYSLYPDNEPARWWTALDPNKNVISTTDVAGATRQCVYSDKGLPLLITDALGYSTSFTYNTQGRMTSREDALGGMEAWTYDSYGNMLTHQDALGRTTTYTYVGTGSTRLLASRQDALGNTTHYTYTSWGALHTVTSPLGFTTTYAYDSYGQLISETDPEGHTRTYSYDVAGNRISEEDPLGRFTYYAYDAKGRQTSRSNNIGATYTTLYDRIGRVTSEVDPLGHRTTYLYGPHFNLDTGIYNGTFVTRQDAKGYLWTTMYDLLGSEWASVDPLNKAVGKAFDARRLQVADRIYAPNEDPFAQDPYPALYFGNDINQVTYDLAQRPVAVLEATGLTTTTIYDPLDRVIGQVQSSGLINTTVYDTASQMIATIEPTGHIYSHLYDLAGRHWVIQEPTGARTTTLYDADGRAVGSIDPMGHRTTTIYDRTGRILVAQDPGGRLSTTIYDATGARSQEFAYDGTFVQRFYDGAAREVGTLDHLGQRTTNVYDLKDRMVSFTNEAGNTYGGVYDPLDLMTGSVDELGNRYTTLYDAGQRPTLHLDAQNNPSTLLYDGTLGLGYVVSSYTDPVGATTEYTYDGAALRLVGVTDPLGNSTGTFYDPVTGRLVATVDEAGYFTTILYDDWGRTAATQDPYGSLFTINFDAFNRTIGLTDPLGYQTTQALDMLHRPVAQTNALGYRTSVVYDVLSNIALEIDELGYTTSHLYDGQGNWTGRIDALCGQVTQLYDQFSRPIAYQDPLGNTSTTIFDALNRIWMQLDPMGYVITNIYDSHGRLQATQDQASYLTTTQYDPYGLISAIIDAQGNSVVTVYDRYWRVAADVDALGNRTSYGYDALRRIVSAQDANGQTSQNLWDSRGNLAGSIDAQGNRTTSVYDGLNRFWWQQASTGEITSNNYDPVDNLIAYMDASGNRTTYLYDGVGQQIAVMDSNGNLTNYLYNGRGELVVQVDAMGRRTTNLYDAVGQPIRTTDPIGVGTTTLYDPAGRVVANVNARGFVTTYIYDGLGRQIGMQDALGYRTSSVYDSRGNLLASINAMGYRSSYVYNALSQQVASMDALGYVTSSLYDAQGRQIATLDALNRRTTIVYDSIGRVVGMQYADDSTESMVYDSNGNLIATVDGLGHTTSNVYGASNRLVGRIDPLGRRQTFAYDTADRLLAYTDAKGQITTHLYDSRNLEVGRIYADDSRVTLSYNSLSQLAGVADSTGLYTFGYDALGRMSSHIGPGYPLGLPITLVYDANGNRTAMETWQGTFTAIFDPRDQQTLLQDPGFAAAGVVGGSASFSYNAWRQKVTQVNPNGTSVSLIYDPLGRVSQLRHLTSGGTAIEQALYDYDAVGRPKGKSTLASVSSYGYDTRDRLITENNSLSNLTTYGYDVAGRRINIQTPALLSTYDYDVADQLLAIQLSNDQITTFLYDLNGNTISVQTPANTTSYSWDIKNRLTQVLMPSGVRFTQTYRFDDLRVGQSSLNCLDAFLYDDFGTGNGKSPLPNILLWQRQSTGGGGTISPGGNMGTPGAGAGGVGPGATDSTPIEGSSLLTQVYVQATENGSGPVRMVGASSTLTYNRQFHLDAQGNVEALTTGSQSVEADYTLDAFGNVMAGSAQNNPLVFGGGLGYWQEPDLGLEYVRARWLNTETGSWLSSDPVHTEPKYSFVHNSPTWKVDPSGKQKEERYEHDEFDIDYYIRKNYKWYDIPLPELNKDFDSLPSNILLKYKNFYDKLQALLPQEFNLQHRGIEISLSLRLMGGSNHNLVLATLSYHIAELKQAQATHYATCGPEIGYALRQALTATVRYFHTKWDSWQKIQAAYSLITPEVALKTWDIEELGPNRKQSFYDMLEDVKCPTPNTRCEDTVMVDGECHLAWAVNYIMFGLIMKLSHDYFYELQCNSAAQQRFIHDRMNNSRVPLLKFFNPAPHLEAIESLNRFKSEHLRFTEDQAVTLTTNFKNLSAVIYPSGGYKYGEHAAIASQWVRAGYRFKYAGNSVAFQVPTTDKYRKSCLPCNMSSVEREIVQTPGGRRVYRYYPHYDREDPREVAKKRNFFTVRWNNYTWNEYIK